MRVSLDTTVWVFGIIGVDPYCESILLNLSRFEIVVPDQIRAELERNLADQDRRQFYQFALRFGIDIHFEDVPSDPITSFQGRELKKGDAETGAYCEWRRVDIVVSGNKDFLKGLSGEQQFAVASPRDFCAGFDL